MLFGQIALVTGGGRGIGRAVALRFAAEHCAVAVAARTSAEIEAVAAECRELGVPSLAVAFDVTDATAWTEAMATVVGEFGHLDILVNCAGGGIFKRVADLASAEFDQVLAQNLRSVFLGLKAAQPYLLSQAAGRIINISSMAAYGGGPEYAAYSASKAAVNNLTETMALEYRELGMTAITCNAVCPGPVASRLRSSHFPAEDPASIMQPEAVADVVLFLASPAAAGVSGTAINVRHY